MEFPRRLVRLEQALAAALLLGVGIVARFESLSPAATAARSGQTWSCWLALRAPSAALPQLFLALYQPARRTVDLIYVPETTALDDGRTLAQAYAAARRDGAGEIDAAKDMADAAEDTLHAASRFYFSTAAEWDGMPPLAGRRWLAARTQGLGFWRSLARPPQGAGLEPFELYRAAQEFHGVAPERLRAAWLPAPDDRAAYLSRLASSVEDRGDRAITVEVLNASGGKGIASHATKILRSRGADVMSTGNAASQARTIVYDRTGRPELATEVLRMLGCDSAETVTQIDMRRLVDVSVVIAGDCP